MSKRYVTLGDGRRVGLGAYCTAWKAVLAAPGVATYRSGLEGRGIAASRATILEMFRAGMQDRINRHDRRLIVNHRGRRPRKLDQDWQRHAIQTAQAVNTPRLVVRWVPHDLRARLAHRITKEES